MIPQGVPEELIPADITSVPIHQRTVIQSADDHAGDFRDD